MKKKYFLIILVLIIINIVSASPPISRIYNITGEDSNNAWFRTENYLPPYVLNESFSDVFNLSWSFLTNGSVKGGLGYYSSIIYAGSSDGYVYSLNYTDGALNWKYKTDGSVKTTPYAYAIYSSGVYKYYVSFGSDDGKIYALNLNTGKKVWSYQTGGAVQSSPGVYNEAIYVGSDDGRVYALNYSSGKQIWNYTTGGSVRSSPGVFYDSLTGKYAIFFGSDDGKVYALNVDNGNKLWSYQTDGAVQSSPGVYNEAVYVGSDDGKVYALNITNGKQIWNYITGGSVKSSPKANKNIIYIGSDDGRVYALNITNGKQIWNYTTGGSVRSSAVFAKSSLYIGSNDGKIYALDINDGIKRNEYFVGSGIEGSLLFYNYALHFGSDDSNIYSIRLPDWFEYTSGEYDLIENPDDGFFKYSDTSLYDSSYFRFNITEDVKEVVEMDFYFKGYSDLGETKVYVFNTRTLKWDFLDSVEKDGNLFKFSLRKESIDDSVFRDYINDSYMWVIVQSPTTVGGSCPFVYSFDGEKYWFDHEGFAFATMSISETSSFGRLEHLKAVDGEYKIRIGERLDETSWINNFKLNVVDHKGDGEVVPDVKGNAHTINEKVIPNKCFSKEKSECLSEVKNLDSNFWKSDKYSEEYDWIEIEFDNPEKAEEGKLLIYFQGAELLKEKWKYYIDLIGDNNWDLLQNVIEIPILKNMFLKNIERNKLMIQIWDGEEWKDLDSVSSGREKMSESLLVVNDIGDKIRVRLKHKEGNYEIDAVYMDFSKDEEMKITELEPLSAVKDYENFIEELSADDEKYVSLEKGDDLDLSYKEIPKYKDWNRDFFVEIKGYYNYDIMKNKSKSELLEGIKIWFESYFNEDYTPAIDGHHTLYIDYIEVNISRLEGGSEINNVFADTLKDSYAKEEKFNIDCGVDSGGGANIGMYFQFKSNGTWYNIPKMKNNQTSNLENSKISYYELIEKIKSTPRISEDELKENKNPELEKEWVRIYPEDEKQLGFAFSMDLDVLDYQENYIDAVATTKEIEKLREENISLEILAFDKGDVFSDFDDYHSYEEIVADMNAIEGNYSDIAKMYEIGKSIENRSIWAMKISDEVEIDEEEPEIFIVGNHHAREVMTVEIPLYEIHYLVENYKNDYIVGNLVDNREIWIVPTVNPDGLTYVQNNDSMWRKNRKNNGNGIFGVDLNRNYGYKWGYDNVGSSPTSSSETYRGVSAFSEPETQAVRDFIQGHNITYALSYHSYGEYLLYPWGYVNSHTPDHERFLELSEGMLEELDWYNPGTPGELLYLVNGEFDDWSYGEQTTKNKIFGMTFEVNTASEGFRPSPSEIIPTSKEHIPAFLYFLEEAGSEIKRAIEIDENKQIDIIDNQTYAGSVVIHESGEYELRCLGFNFSNSVSSEIANINILTPAISVEIIEPANKTKVKKGEIFNFKINISCTNFNCGDITAYLDPELQDEKQYSLDDSDNGYIIEFYEKPAFTLGVDKNSRVKLLKKRIESNDFGVSSSFKLEKQINELKKEIKEDIELQLSKIKDEHDKFKKDAFDKINEGGAGILIEPPVKNEFFKIFNGMSLDISKEDAEKLLELPYVKRIVPNKEYQIDMDYTVDWLNVAEVWNYESDGYSLTGNGVVIANIDTGVEITHAMFGNDNNSVFKKCTDFTNCSKVLDAWDFQNNDAKPWDDNGHGTHTSSTNAGINDGVLQGGMAPDARLYVYKVCNSKGSCQWSYMIAAVERASDPNNDGDFEDHANLISMSLGGSGTPDDITSIAIDNAADIGIISIISAGNSGPSEGTIACPSCARKAISVAAACKPFDAGTHSQCPNDIAGFSSRGPLIYEGEDLEKPEIIAPGVWICAARGVNYQGNSNYPTCFDNKHVRVSGTSMSAPHMAGIGALIVQDNPEISWSEFETLIQDTAVSLGNYTYNEQGAGLINIKEILGAIDIDYVRIEPEIVGLNAKVNCIASVSAREGYNLSYVKFTVTDSEGNIVFDNVVGNQSGLIWTSPIFDTNIPGNWNCEIRASDETNRTKLSSIDFSVGDKGLVSTIEGDKPFYTLDNNPDFSCSLGENESCLINWRVVPTGQVNTSWNFFAYIDSPLLQYLTDVTEVISLEIAPEEDDLPEDINGDDIIDIQDLVAVALYIGSSECGEPDWCNRRDINKDGEVDIQDLVRVALKI